MTVIRSQLAEVPAYVTKDGSSIRELMHPAVQGNARQSLAEASVPPGGATLLHRHRESEELYFIVSGTGRMTLGDEEFAIAPGDTLLIPPGTAHCLRNNGGVTLRLLCACAPPYRHEDTEMLE
ncbi:MAG: cupin domain-containing protein [Gallionellaceae bacterium]|nr:cupin domain-containing protein [Gallionellaceae bacterium]